MIERLLVALAPGVQEPRDLMCIVMIFTLKCRHNPLPSGFEVSPLKNAYPAKYYPRFAHSRYEGNETGFSERRSTSAAGREHAFGYGGRSMPVSFSRGKSQSPSKLTSDIDEKQGQEIQAHSDFFRRLFGPIRV